MKKYLLFLISICVASCSDYLDVKPVSQIDKNALFQTEEGFYEALNGVYSRAIGNDLYGEELTFGFLDVLAQNYSVFDIAGSKYPYQQTANYNYTEKNFIDRKNRVWEGLYNAIGNCNSLLENLEIKGKILSPDVYPIVKGEALALRAYFHLDIIRMFAPSYKSNPTAPAVPYVTRFSNLAAPQLTVAAALDSVIADLTSARTLLRGIDPIAKPSYKVGYTTDGDDADTNPDDGSNEEQGSLFLQNRRHRMNYYAVCGTLARAHLCRNNKSEALAFAKEVIESNKFPAVKREDFGNVEEEKQDLILYPELVFAWAIPTQVDELRDRFERGNSSLNVRLDPGNAIYETGSVGAEDLRIKEWFKIDNSTTARLELRKYHRENTNKHPLMAPAIRLSEMYYIASECSYPINQNDAWSYFNKARFNRGIAGAYEIWSGDEQKLLTELLKEARKEFYGEGQIFYMYKRLNKNIKGLDGSETPASNKVFVLPMPDDEIRLGQRD
ncbi:RagB/SusD family nutrient uptake outer membrane protein [Chryseosolibacter indicus]|uniref:RagB/SusD family nutrient uptake outer membrane protein n=1 Tax=Chryseosolibacter indicus TaxID=2782351 RepID=A0ABS5VXK4_9BACT|nr:RagB/SusD family nutrient uptake outer membrane protein [Chryseosolibacter indicus]MBT1705986.1 RagB/SusD family nutrient uptake outer membrane protein [Chryseosolibacter indicus]